MMKILIVDDNQKMREMMRSYLQTFSGEISECADGAEALQAYREFLPDFVLMDWQMSRVDGITATREILKNFPDARIFMITQFDDAELRSSAAEAGICGFVLKDDLHAVREVLRSGGTNL